MMSLCRAGSDARRGLQCANSANSGCIRGRKRGYSLGIAEKREQNSASIRSVFPLLARLPGRCSTPCCTPASARRLPGGGCGRSCTCRHTCNCPGCEVRGKEGYGEPVLADFAGFVERGGRRGGFWRRRRRRKRRRRRRHGILEKNRPPGARTWRRGERKVVHGERIDKLVVCS